MKLEEDIDLINNIKSIINFVPLNLKWLTEIDHIVFEDTKLKTSIILDILHTIRVKYNLTDNKNHIKGFPLNSQLLMKNYGNNYSKYMRFMLSDNNPNSIPILRITQNHLAGKNSKMFALNRFYLEEKYFYFRNDNKKAIERKKKQLKDNIIEENNNLVSSFVRMNLYKDLDKFHIDEYGAHHTLNVLHESGKINKEKFDINIKTVEMSANKLLEFSPDKHGRIHTLYTRLKREVRQNDLQVVNNGILEDICEFDIPNSQPTMLLFILRDNLSEINIDDFIRYREICKTENVYQKLIDYYKIGGKKINREDAKSLIYTYLFGPVISLNGRQKSKESRRIIRLAFIKIFGESIDNWISNYKNNHKDGYKAFSWLLQKYESNIIFNSIVNDIKKYDENIPITTIHDSIIAPKSRELEVKNIFDYHINKIFEEVKIEYI